MKVKVIAILLLAMVGVGCSNDLDKDIKGNPGFVMQGDLACTIAISTSKEDVGKKVSLLALQSTEPKALFEHQTHAGTSPMKVIFEDEDALVIQLVASATGSIDTISLNKKTGVFVRAQIGSVAGNYATAQKGNCK